MSYSFCNCKYLSKSHDLASILTNLSGTRLTLDERLELACSVGSDNIQLEELRDLLDQISNPIAYDGFEPSGRMDIEQARLCRLVCIGTLISQSDNILSIIICASEAVVVTATCLLTGCLESSEDKKPHKVRNDNKILVRTPQTNHLNHWLSLCHTWLTVPHQCCVWR